MTSLTLPRFTSRLPLSLTRVASALHDAWERWRERRLQRRALEALTRLEPATLRDLGLEDALISRAHEIQATQARLAGGVDRW